MGAIALFVLATLFLLGDARRVRAGQAGRAILLDIEDVLGRDQREVIHKRGNQMEDHLSHTFRSLPQNSRGALSAPAAGYALHRLFLQLHGWQMKGLQPSGSAWSEQSPTSLLLNRGINRLHDIFEERLSQHGLDLHELSTLAACIELQVRDEADSLLNVSLQASGIYHMTKELGATDAYEVMEAYMASYVLGTEKLGGKGEITANDVRLLRRNIGSYPRWQQVRDLVRESVEQIAPATKTFNFKIMSDILLATSDNFFKLEDKECRALSNQLVEMEDQSGSGRVLMNDFYRPAFHTGMLEFTESSDYLRQQGALDETDPSSPRVIIPNYIMADSNCLANSNFYSVCCVDMCEEMMDQIEMSVQAPSATPEHLLAVVNQLPGASISKELADKLEEVAENSHGEVPLHGRLFAQWMHHAFPRQCVFPHLAGAITKQSLGEFTAERHESAAFAGFEEMKEIIEGHSSSSSRPRNDFSMWSEDEELVDARGFEQHIQRPRSSTPWSCFWMVSVLAGFVGTVAKLAPEMLSSSGSSIYHQKMV